MTAYEDGRLEAATRHACFAADTVAIGFKGTNAQKTRASIGRALEMLLANGIIEIKPRDEWPEWILIDPPYEFPNGK